MRTDSQNRLLLWREFMLLCPFFGAAKGQTHTQTLTKSATLPTAKNGGENENMFHYLPYIKQSNKIYIHTYINAHLMTYARARGSLEAA